MEETKEVTEVTENKNSVVSQKGNISTDLTVMSNNVKKFTTLDLSNEEDKKSLYNATQECDIRLNDIVGTTIEVSNIYIEERERQEIDDETGEVKNVPKFRTILFGTNGQTYVASAYGVYNSIMQIMDIFGLPTEEAPYTLIVKKRPLGDGKETLILVLA